MMRQGLEKPVKIFKGIGNEATGIARTSLAGESATAA